MSRVAKKPITLPKGVEVTVAENGVTVKGAKGSLTQAMPQGLGLKIDGGEALVEVGEGGGFAMAGTLRALVANMVTGVSEGYSRKLELVGVGYRAQMQGSDLSLALGFSHPVLFKAPAGVTLEAPSLTEIWVRGTDKQAVGQVAAKIRAFRPPEPYKGKGVRYHGERITIKEAKKA